MHLCKTCDHQITCDAEHYGSPRWVHATLVDAALCIAHRDGSWCLPAAYSPVPVEPFTAADVANSPEGERS
jgi:hypothetical protein